MTALRIGNLSEAALRFKSKDCAALACMILKSCPLRNCGGHMALRINCTEEGDQNRSIRSVQPVAFTSLISSREFPLPRWCIAATIPNELKTRTELVRRIYIAMNA